MTSDQMQQLKKTKEFLEDLCDPGKTPRVPGSVRNRARVILKSFTHADDTIPDVLEKKRMY